MPSISPHARDDGNQRSQKIRTPTLHLIVGLPGSGKTTSLYAFMREIHTPDIKIITIEDPVEYHLEGIVQTQTNGKDYTFASGLRSVLRQDPDVLLVGETRDKDTAHTAVEAALRVVVRRNHQRKDLVKVLVVAPLRLMRGALLAPAVNGQCHGVARYGNSG